MKLSFKNIIGKHLLMGITYLDSEGTVQQSFQLHGTIVAADKRDSIQFNIENDPLPASVNLPEDGIFALPPDIKALKPADKGIYTLKSTGEDVIDPDLICSWSVRAPE
jgi:hypothetical protein